MSEGHPHGLTRQPPQSTSRNPVTSTDALGVPTSQQHPSTGLPLLLGIVSMANSGPAPKSLDFPTIRFLPGRNDLPLDEARVQPAVAGVVSQCMSRMRIRDRVVRVDQWLIFSKASTFNSSTIRCGLVFSCSKRCSHTHDRLLLSPSFRLNRMLSLK